MIQALLLSFVMVVTGPTSQPIGHYEFCQRLLEECQPTRVYPLEGADVIGMAEVVNLLVNHSIVSVTDREYYGVNEWWAYPDEGYGDCEDIALEKLRELIELGVSPSNLLLTVVRLPVSGEGHAVLTLRTVKGDFILDNLTDEVKLWTDTDYWFIKRQSPSHAGLWENIDDDVVSSF